MKINIINFTAVAFMSIITCGCSTSFAPENHNQDGLNGIFNVMIRSIDEKAKRHSERGLCYSAIIDEWIVDALNRDIKDVRNIIVYRNNHGRITVIINYGHDCVLVGTKDVENERWVFDFENKCIYESNNPARHQ